jgi:hypothetical protein
MMGLRKLTATAVAGALLATSATPALARPGWGAPGGWGGGHRRWGHRGDGIDAGDVILGAIILGGIAAVASAASSSNRDRTSKGDWGGGWSRDEGTEDAAVDSCARAAEREGARYGQDARVEDITSVARQDGGWRVYGVVSADRGNGNDRYGDKSRFSCTVRYGQVEDVRFEDDRSAWDR